MPAVSSLEEWISGIEPIFVTRHDRLQSKHPISSIHRLKEEARSTQGGMPQASPQNVDEASRGRLRIC